MPDDDEAEIAMRDLGAVGEAEAIVRTIACRCPELAPHTLDLISAALAGEVVPATIFEDVHTVLTEFEERLDSLGEKVG
jgi:hypothetical protein